MAQSLETSSDRRDYAEIVNRRRANELDVFSASIGKSHIYESHSNVTDDISVSYKGRTLIELIQNGYDPHSPNKADGEVSILLDLTESRHGCLYVANRGNGFEEKNFDGICDMARSPKPVNQGIGNKGLGFRSVFQVCQNPEIYSQDGPGRPSGDFEGFRFTFPSDAQLSLNLKDSEHSDILDEILTTVPRSLLPVNLPTSPDAVLRYAHDGFATVIRMPLDRPDAADDIREQIHQICDHDLPIQIFLERLESIRIQIVDEDSDAETRPFERVLKRNAHKRWSEDEIRFELVEIDDELEYLVVKHALPDSDFRPRLLAGLASKQLPDAWERWEGAAEISIAVHTSGDSDIGRLYTFLPMESTAESPFAGHANAPFLCDIDRTKLVDNVDLNDFFINEIAGLCLRTAEAVKKRLPEVSRNVSLDLTVWTQSHWQTIDEVAQQEFGRSISQLPLIPSCTGSANFPWTSIDNLSGWPEFSVRPGILCPATIAPIANLDFVDESLDSNRLDRLKDLSWRLCNVDLDPDYDEIATWSARIAEQLVSGKAPISDWNQYYEDLVAIFANSAEHLQGTSILLTENYGLADTLNDGDAGDEEPKKDRRRRRSKAVFFPSTRTTKEFESGDEEEDLEEESLSRKIPASLNNSVQLLHSELSCAKRKDESGVRSFLIDNRLVNSFRREDLQRVLANLTESPGPGKQGNRRRYDALQFSFELSDHGTRVAELDEMPFHVPASNGEWIPARTAHFGADWPKTLGFQIEGLIEAASPYSAEISALRNQIVTGLKAWDHAGGATKDWVKFLRKLGVTDTLRVINARPKGAFKTHGISLRKTLLDRCVESDSLRSFWEEALPNEPLNNPYTQYTVRKSVPMLAGLNDYDAFPATARRLYAVELLKAITAHEESLFIVSIYRPEHQWQPHATTWPSPLLSFLRCADWLPASSPTSKQRFFKPSDIWHAPRTGAPAVANILPVVEGECRQYLIESEATRELLQSRCDLNVIDSAPSADEQVVQLGRLAADSAVLHSDVPTFDALYAEGWRLLSQDPQVLADTLNSDNFCLATHVNDDVQGIFFGTEDSEGSIDIDGAEPPDFRAFIADDVSPTKRDLLKEIGKPLFDFKFETRALVAEHLCERFDGLQRVSQVELDVYIDDALYKPVDTCEYLISTDRRWLQDTLIVICDLSSAFLTLGRSGLDAMTARLAKVRFQLVGRIEIEIDGHRHDIPEFMQGCLSITEDDGPLILIESSANSLSWSILQRAAYAIAEALGSPAQLSHILSSAFAQLTAIQGPATFSPPTEGDYQAICRKGPQAINESLRGLRHITEILLEVLRPVILSVTDNHHYERIIGELEAANSESEIVNILKLSQSVIPLDTGDIVDACRRSESLDGTRRELAIDLLTFNNALDRLGAPYQALEFAEEQTIAFRSYVKKSEPRILNCLRQAFVGAFDDHYSLDEYVTARAMDDLLAAPEWSTEYDEVPEALFEQRIDRWLTSNSAGAIADSEPLNAIECADCRDANRKLLGQFVSSGWAAVTAWCRQNNVDLPEPWRNRKEAPQLLVQLAQGSGWLDFRVLSADNALARLKSAKVWPEGMPLSIDAGELGLSEADINGCFEAERQREEEQNRLANTISIGDQELSLLQDDLAGALDAVSQLFDENQSLWASASRVTRLNPMPTDRQRKAGHGGKPGSRGRAPKQLPSGQKEAIGLLGEKLAFKWLKTRYPGLVNEKCWVSGNRERALQAEPGNDMLGYDFSVAHPNYEIYYEVKATQGDDAFFRLGPTEVEAAIRCRADSKYRYRILFIRRISDPAQTEILLLPNPYSEAYKDRFRVVTQGEVGLRFDPN